MAVKCSILVLSWLLLVSNLAWADSELPFTSIENIKVDCQFTTEMPEPVKDRIIATLNRTLERLLTDEDSKSIEYYNRMKEEIESNIKEGLNIVFESKGYQIDSLKIEFAETTTASIVVSPSGQIIDDVSLKLETGNFHPFWNQRINRVFTDSHGTLLDYYEPLLVGLPVNPEDSDWAYNLVKDQCLDTSHVDDLFYDMEIHIDINRGVSTRVVISLVPVEPVAETLRVRAYSRSVFQLVLDPLKESVASHSNIIVGMPLTWLENNRAEIEKEYVRILSSDLMTKKINLHNECRLYFQDRDPGTAFLEIKTESIGWHFGAEVNVDVGNDETPDEAEVHLGAKFAERFEVFSQLNFYPDDIRFRPDIGLGVHPFPGMFIAAGWDIYDGDGKLYYTQYLTRDIKIEAEVFSDDAEQDQYGVVYKPFQFVSFGLFTDGDDDYWLRTAFAF